VNAQDKGKTFIGYCHLYVERIAQWLITEPDGGAKNFAKLSKALDWYNRVQEGKAKAKIRPTARQCKDRAVMELRDFLKLAQGFIRRSDTAWSLGGPECFRELWPRIEGEIREHPEAYIFLNANLDHLKRFLYAMAKEGGLLHHLSLSPELFAKEWMPFGSKQSEEYYTYVVSMQGKGRKKQKSGS
jgi:hypothetical protein